MPNFNHDLFNPILEVYPNWYLSAFRIKGSSDDLLLLFDC